MNKNHPKIERIVTMTLCAILISLGLVLAGCGQAATSSTDDLQSSEQITASSSEVQKVNLGFQDSDYYPQKIIVKANQPVEITADVAKLPGCAKSFNIPSMGVKKTFKTDDNIVTFTPMKKGSFSFTCSMGMYRGTIEVV